MNFVKLSVAACAALVVTGCNSGQPRIWRVAYNDSAFGAVENSSCYVGNAVRPISMQKTNYRRDANWVIWDGVPDASGQLKQYLDIGNREFRLGHSPIVKVEDAIEGDASTRRFMASHETASPGPSPKTSVESRLGRVQVEWDNFNPAATGKVTITSQYRCNDTGQMLSQQCPKGGAQDPVSPDSVSCEVVAEFVARRIDVTQSSFYSNSGCDGVGCP